MGRVALQKLGCAASSASMIGMTVSPCSAARASRRLYVVHQAGCGSCLSLQADACAPANSVPA